MARRQDRTTLPAMANIAVLVGAQWWLGWRGLVIALVAVSVGMIGTMTIARRALVSGD